MRIVKGKKGKTRKKKKKERKKGRKERKKGKKRKKKGRGEWKADHGRRSSVAAGVGRSSVAQAICGGISVVQMEKLEFWKWCFGERSYNSRKRVF